MPWAFAVHLQVELLSATENIHINHSKSPQQICIWIYCNLLTRLFYNHLLSRRNGTNCSLVSEIRVGEMGRSLTEWESNCSKDISIFSASSNARAPVAQLVRTSDKHWENAGSNPSWISMFFPLWDFYTSWKHFGTDSQAHEVTLHMICIKG